MRTIAILPIKSFGAAKQRLSGQLGGGAREALAQAMFTDVLSSLRRTPGVDSIAVVTANRTAESAVRRTGAVLLYDHLEAGQSAAALVGISHALEHGFDRALLVPGDTPLLDPGELSDTLASATDGAVVIVPDRHGTGTNALLLSPPDAIAPSFGPGSREGHRACARDAGLAYRIEDVESLGLDIDTPDDLTELSRRLEQGRGRAPLTSGALRQLERSAARGPVAVARPIATSRIRV